ncbi:MAG: hypothetical protein NZ926_01185 [Candidatus Methanomethylicia archaeon]|nr:hypothetical protein [Candidatus Methanomethylicia archaeon]MCX8169044.1 hypothetical protein [Candidatus Methanomethylicia archaeon]MDW7988776.1 RNA-binding domain-containing protein [Nitrososphaerota archaeon]
MNMTYIDFPISEISFNAFCHVTEDLDKVQSAMLNLLPEPFRSNINIVKEIMEGHYGNTIFNLKVHIIDKEIIESTLKYICEKLCELDKRLLFRTFNLRFDKSKNLYLRFDKGEAYKGLLRLCDGGDVVRMILKFECRMEIARSVCLNIGLISGV